VAWRGAVWMAAPCAAGGTSPAPICRMSRLRVGSSAIVTLALASNACIGRIGEHGPEGAPLAGPTGEPTSAACEGKDFADTLGPSPLQRLTRTEYDSAIRDLLGIEGHPADALPEDDHVGPFESNTKSSVGEHTVALYAELADGLAETAVKDLATLLPCYPAAADDACAAQFVMDFGRRAYRRPLSADERDRILVAYGVGKQEGDFANGIRLVISAMLQSPSFLYRVELGVPGPADDVVALTPYELATRLSFFLWKAPPDDELLAAAGAGDLDTEAGLVHEAERLVEDPRADAAVQSFHVQWLGLDALATTEKDPELFPAYTDSLRAAMLTESQVFVVHVYREDGGRIETLFTAPYTYADAELAALYGADPPADELGKVQLDASQRSGLLTQAGFLAVRSGFSQTSPTRRGQLVRDRILCDTTPPPPPNVNDVLPPKKEGDTKKQQLESHVSDPSCAGCHNRMDPIGFGFEHYDPIGAFRTKDGAFPVDATGEIQSASSDLVGPFDGAIELSERLAKSPQVHRCFALQWARFGLGREESEEEAKCGFGPALEFGAEGPSVREILLRVVALEAFRHRRIPTLTENKP